MIDQELASFLQQGIAIQLGTRNERLEPNGARVVAVSVERDGRHVVAYVADAEASAVLSDLESNAQAAIACARPPDERACQLKGTFTGVRRAPEEEKAFVLDQWNRWLDRLTTIGYERGMFDHWSAWPCVAIRVEVTSIFNQTPGPGAGARHVALSFQFFNKSKANISENPHAVVQVIDPDTSQGWQLRLRYVRSETAGPVFERMALRIEAIASYSGLKGIFRLLAADIYEVLSVTPVEGEGPRAAARDHARARPVDAVFTMQALQDLAGRIHRADCLERLLDSILEGIEASFGFNHSMILVPGSEDGVLVAIASRGYPENGVGAEVRIGEGIAGLVAEARKPIRIAGLIRQMLYAFAVHKRASEQGLCPQPERRIALPGLAAPDSQLGVPLLNRGELVGVLCIESEMPYRFHEEDKASIALLGSYLAIAIHAMLLQERAESLAEASAPAAVPAPGPRVEAPQSALSPERARATHDVTYYASDECILLDGEYLIRSLPARILWKLLNVQQSQKRLEFTNRELRLDKSLNLPEWKDNLESRLLLRRRLEQKCPDLRIVPKARGRFALELGADVRLVQRP